MTSGDHGQVEYDHNQSSNIEDKLPTVEISYGTKDKCSKDDADNSQCELVRGVATFLTHPVVVRHGRGGELGRVVHPVRTLNWVCPFLAQ